MRDTKQILDGRTWFDDLHQVQKLTPDDTAATAAATGATGSGIVFSPVGAPTVEAEAMLQAGKERDLCKRLQRERQR
jgi:hypothetical protein